MDDLVLRLVIVNFVAVVKKPYICGKNISSKYVDCNYHSLCYFRIYKSADR